MHYRSSGAPDQGFKAVRGGAAGGTACGSDTTATAQPALPCLYSNNCIIDGGKTPLQALSELEKPLSTQHKKSASALAWNVMHLVEKYGIENVGFLTLTFAENITDPRESQKRFHSLKTNVLSSRYLDLIRVYERTKRGRIHYHLLIVTRNDIRTGFDFDQVKNHNYKSANKALRDEWAFWRTTAKAYGFGRTELMPIKSTAEGIGRYVGKYISKNVIQRQEVDKGFRLVEYSRGARMASTRFNFVTIGSRQWREKIAVFARIVGFTQGLERPCRFHEFKELLGPHWAHHHRDFIASLPSTPLGVYGFLTDIDTGEQVRISV